jgi:cytochrome d ubiquinol oxidase subunit I
MRTADAVTPAKGIWWVFGVTMALYAALGVIAITVLRGLSRRWREGAPEAEIPYGPPPGERSGASA